MKALFSHYIGRAFVLVRSIGPYAAIELLLPGGSMLALLYWWHRHRARQMQLVSKSGTRLEVQPFSGSPSARNSVRALRAAVSRTSTRLRVRQPIARGEPRAAPLSSCRSLAA